MIAFFDTVPTFPFPAALCFRSFTVDKRRRDETARVWFTLMPK